MREIDKGCLPIAGKRRRVVFGFFAVALFLLVLIPGAHADQVCSDCHDTGPHGLCDAGNCAACHGNPPLDAGGLIHPYAGMLNPAASGATSAGAHMIHATPSGSNYPCSTCHYNGMSASSTQMVGGTGNGNGSMQMGFSIAIPGGQTLNGGTYDGVSGAAYPYEGTNGTAVTLGGMKTCSNIYCHSNGTSVATGIIQASVSPSWDSPGPLACSACHGFPPLYPNDQPKANSHDRHTFIGCNICHYATTIDGTTITDFTRHKNANSVYDVVPDPDAAYMGAHVSFSYLFDAGGGQCSNVTCHGPIPNHKNWGGVELTAGIGWTPGPACLEVQLTGQLNGTPPEIFDWNFGDGQTGQGENVSHVYAQSGQYAVQLSAIDAHRHRAAASVYVAATAINALPVPGRTITVSGYTVTVTDYSTDPDFNTCGHSGSGTVRVQWGVAGVPETTVSADLTDTPPAVGRTVSRTYTSAGTYVVRHSVKDNALSPYVYSQNQTITVPATYSAGGKVVRLDGTTPVPNASVRLKNGSQIVKTTSTNTAGNYSFLNVLPGSYTVEAVKTGLTFSNTPAAIVTNTSITVPDIIATR